MEREGGLVGRLLAYAVLDNKLPPLWETRPEDYPLAGEILRDATGLIVHSHYVEERARATGYDGPIVRIPHPAWPIPEIAASKADGDPLFGCFGHLNETKTHRGARARLCPCRDRLPERAAPPRRLACRRLAAARAPQGRRRRDYVPRTALALIAGLRRDRLPALADDRQDLRRRVRALSLGEPLVVRDLGWFAELPDDALMKVPSTSRGCCSLAALTRSSTP